MERYIKASELAEKLGVSEQTIYRLTRSGEIPAYRIGRMLRYKLSEVEKSRAIKDPAPSEEEMKSISHSITER